MMPRGAVWLVALSLGCGVSFEGGRAETTSASSDGGAAPGGAGQGASVGGEGAGGEGAAAGAGIGGAGGSGGAVGQGGSGGATAPCNLPDEVGPGGHCYSFPTALLGWHEARAACVVWGGELVALSDGTEHAFVTPHIGPGTWIGGNDIAQTDVYEWSNGEAWLFTQWDPSQPDSAAEDCVLIAGDGDYWDENCPIAKPYVCER